MLVTVAEHIGDHSVLGKIVDREFLKEPGLKRTLVGDGVATAFSAFIGGPVNTTYGENTGVIGMTRIASVSVIRNAAFIAIGLSFMGKFIALISTIPNAVLGGMSILLYGVIASNGLKVMIDIVGIVTLSGTALSAMTGIALNLILPKDESEYEAEYESEKIKTESKSKKLIAEN